MDSYQWLREWDRDKLVLKGCAYLIFGFVVCKFKKYLTSK